MEELGGLPFMGLHRVGHDWQDLAAAAAKLFAIACLSSSNLSTLLENCISETEVSSHTVCTISSFAFLHCLCAFRSREIYVGMKQVACIAVPRLTNPLSLIQESGFFHKHQGNQLLCNLLAAGGGLVAKSSLTLTTPWTVAYKAPRSMGFPRQEYWSGLPFPFPLVNWQVFYTVLDRFWQTISKKLQKHLLYQNIHFSVLSKKYI